MKLLSILTFIAIGLVFTGFGYLAMADNATTDIEVNKRTNVGFKFLGAGGVLGIVTYLIYKRSEK